MANNTNNPERVMQWSYVALAWAGVIALLVGVYTVCTWARSIAPTHTIVVNGEGRSTIKPDIALISFSVVSEGANPTALQDDNNQKINAAIDAVKNLGVEEDDIQTTGYNLSPRYQYDPKTGRSKIDGYTLTQTVNVKVRDLENVSPILTALPGLGINQISGPNFSVEDQEKFLNEARQEAFTDARAKARELAELAGVRLGRIVTFSENGGGYPIPYMYAKAELGMGGDSVAPPRIEAGSEEVSVNVSVTFEIR